MWLLDGNGQMGFRTGTASESGALEDCVPGRHICVGSQNRMSCVRYDWCVVVVYSMSVASSLCLLSGLLCRVLRFVCVFFLSSPLL